MIRPRLTYFAMRGRAEAIRLLLHATMTDFDDHRIVTSDEWTALKIDLPFGVLPTYRDTEGILCESHAILRFLGRTLMAAGVDARRAADLDAVHDVIAELQEDLWRFNWRDRYYEHLESYANDTLLPRLSRLQSWMSKSHGEWLGESFCHVDCLAFCYLDEIDAFFPAVLEDFPKLSDLHARVAAVSGISAYLQSTVRPPVFGMGRMGPKVDPRAVISSNQLFHNPWTEPVDMSEAAKRQRRLTGDA